MVRQDKRRHIMQAAEKLSTTCRFHEITMDDIASLARVGKGTIYRYFEDKDDLFLRTATAGFEELCELLHRKVPGGAPFREQLLSACVEITSFFGRRRQLFRMMQTEDGRLLRSRGGVREIWMQKRRMLLGAMTAILEKGVAAGQVRSDIPAPVLASFLLGMLRTRAHDLEDAPEAMRRHEVVLDVFCRGAQAAAAPAERGRCQ